MNPSTQTPELQNLNRATDREKVGVQGALHCPPSTATPQITEPSTLNPSTLNPATHREEVGVQRASEARYPPSTSTPRISEPSTLNLATHRENVGLQ